MDLDIYDAKTGLSQERRNRNIFLVGDDSMMNFYVEVWGDYALFSRPEMKVERVSYDVITPSAARGLEAVYWHPEIKYNVRRIFVLNITKTAE